MVESTITIFERKYVGKELLAQFKEFLSTKAKFGAVLDGMNVAMFSPGYSHKYVCCNGGRNGGEKW
jgi:hypothetical protein